MSSSPEKSAAAASAVKTFEYRESGTLGLLAPAAANPGAHGHGNGAVASPDLERLLAEARAEGVREGLQQAQQKAAGGQSQEHTKIAEAIRDFERQAGEYYSRVEVELVHLALAIAAKILHREAQVDRMLVAALVKVALEKLQQGTRVAVHVRPEEVAAWNEYLQANIAGRMHIEVKSDFSVEPRHCILETELGETELGLDAQLKEIERGFFDLLAQRPEGK